MDQALLQAVHASLPHLLGRLGHRSVGFGFCFGEQALSLKPITGLPSPMMGRGILTPRVIETHRKVLGRPSGGGSAGGLNHTVPSPTGMIEDLAVVAERHQLAKWLDVAYDTVPTDTVSYTFPWRVWVPCVLEDDCDVSVSLRFEGNGIFRMYNPIDRREVDITARGEVQSYLEGRITENLRPLCFFDRPGVLLFSDEHPAVILRYHHKTARYLVRTSALTEQEVHPLEMEDMVCRIGQRILVKAQALQQHQPRLFVQEGEEDEDDENGPTRHISSAHMPPDALLLCTLRVPDDATLEGLVPIMVRSFPNAAYGDAMGMDSTEDDITMRLPPLFFHVPIDQVVACLDPADVPMTSHHNDVMLFRGMAQEG